MPRKAPKPIITHTETLCFAIPPLEADIGHWEKALADPPDKEERLARICERQLAQLEALKQMYLFETGTEY